MMIPKEVILEDKYPREDLEAAEKVLERGLPEEETVFKSGSSLVNHFKKRINK